MDSYRVYPALLLWLHVAAAHVPPPGDVDLHCGNLQNRVEWSYGEFPEGLRFRININELYGQMNPVWVDPPILQADLSSLSDPENEYNVTVTAVMGTTESKPAPDGGITFSYYRNSLAAKKCSLDLPPVNVSFQADSSVEVAFEHPWLTYLQRMPASVRQRFRRMSEWSEEELPIFSYKVDVINQNEHKDDCVEDVCQLKFAVGREEQSVCMRITGKLKKILVAGKETYCAKRMPPENNVAVICGVVIPLVLVVVGLIVYMVVRKTTTPSSTLPSFMTFPEQPHPQPNGVQQETAISSVVTSHSKTPLMTDDKESPPPTSVATHPPISPEETLMVEAEAEEEELACPEQEEGYTHGRALEMESDPELNPELLNFSSGTSSYERRPVVAQLSPDEPAEGYH